MISFRQYYLLEALEFISAPKEGRETLKVCVLACKGELTLHLAISEIVNGLELGQDFLITLIVDFFGQSLILFLDHSVHLCRHFASVEML